MQALRYHGRRDIRLDDVAEPEPGAGQVKIAVEAAGICGSDLHEYVGGPISVPVLTPHPLTGEVAPVVFGHEFSGTVVAVGDGVSRTRAGDRVAVNAALWCGTCSSCQRGWTNICRSIGFHGVTGGGGAFAAFDVVDERAVHALPDALPFAVGALLEPLASAVHAVALSGIGPAESALVLGAGPIGLLLVRACLAAGAADVVVVEPSAGRRGAASALGATAVVDPLQADPLAVVLDVTRGLGVAAAFDAAAAPTSLDTAVAATRPRGTVVNVAAWERPVAFNPTSLLLRETTVRGSLAYTGADFDRAVSLAEEEVEVLGSLVTRTVTLDDVIARGFDELAFTRHDDIKVMVQPQQGREPGGAGTSPGQPHVPRAGS